MTAVRDVMTKELITVEPSTSVAAAVTVMGMQAGGAGLAMGKGRLEGIFTKRDLVRAMSHDVSASSQPVAQWMTRNPINVGPGAPVEQALEIMLAGNFRHLPVMEDDRVVGIVSIRDLSRATLREGWQEVDLGV